MTDPVPHGGAPGRDTSQQWLSTAQAAELLGVKVQTVYAYVSRGNLHARRPSDHGAGGRRSQFDRREVERLAARTRRGGRAGSFEVLVDTELTLLDPTGALFFRGMDACALARERTFEDVAELLWNCPTGPRPWRADAAALAAARATAAQLGPSARLVDRCRLAIQLLAGFDPLRDDRGPEHVVAVGRSAIAAAVDALPRQRPPAGSAIVQRLWSALSEREPRLQDLTALQAALSLLADHELAASTLAGRVAASTGADPYLVLLAGLSTLSGTLHGAVSRPVVRMLESALESGDVRQAVADAAEVTAAVPGFGHRVYRGVDPRAEALLDLVAPLNSDVWPTVDAVLAEGSRVSGREANVDFALGALICASDMSADAGELVFAVARLAGLLGHAIEEYRYRLRFRPRAVYTGKEPASRESPTEGET